MAFGAANIQAVNSASIATRPIFSSQPAFICLGLDADRSNRAGLALHLTATFGEGELSVVGRPVRFVAKELKIELRPYHCKLPEDEWFREIQPFSAGEDTGTLEYSLKNSIKIETPNLFTTLPKLTFEHAKEEKGKRKRPNNPITYTGSSDFIRFHLSPKHGSILFGPFLLRQFVAQAVPIDDLNTKDFKTAPRVNFQAKIPSGGIELAFDDDIVSRFINKVILSRLKINRHFTGWNVDLGDLNL